MVGEHIRALKGGRWNHAIDCGDETVIHLAPDGAAASRVRRSYRPEFVAGAEVVEVVTHRERTFPATEVVARAYSRISDPGLAAMFRDSEAFAEWCVTGRLTTPQNTAVLVPGAPPAPLVARAAPAAAPQAVPPAKAPARAKVPPPAKAPARAKAPPAPKAKRASAKAPAPRAKAAQARSKASAKAPARAASKGAAKAKPATKKAAARRASPARGGGGTRRGKR